VKQSEEFRRQTFRANMIIDGLGVIDAAIGASLAEGIATFASQIGELT